MTEDEAARLRALGTPEEIKEMRQQIAELYEAKHRKEWLWAGIKVVMTWTALTAVASASIKTMFGDLREWLAGWLAGGGR